MVDFSVDDKSAISKMQQLVNTKDLWVQRLKKADDMGDNEKVRQAMHHIKSCETAIDRLVADKNLYRH